MREEVRTSKERQEESARWAAVAKAYPLSQVNECCRANASHFLCTREKHTDPVHVAHDGDGAALAICAPEDHEVWKLFDAYDPREPLCNCTSPAVMELTGFKFDHAPDCAVTNYNSRPRVETFTDAQLALALWPHNRGPVGYNEEAKYEAMLRLSSTLQNSGERILVDGDTYRWSDKSVAGVTSWDKEVRDLPLHRSRVIVTSEGPRILWRTK